MSVEPQLSVLPTVIEVGLGRDGKAALLHLVGQRLKVGRHAILNRDLAAGDRPGDQQGTGLDTIGNDRVRARVQLVNAVDGDDAGPFAVDFGPHRLQVVRQIDDLGLLGRIFDNGGALGECRRHQRVLGAANGQFLKQDSIAHQAFRLGDDVARVDLDLGTESSHGVDVQIDGSATDRAAAGQADTRASP